MKAKVAGKKSKKRPEAKIESKSRSSRVKAKVGYGKEQRVFISWSSSTLTSLENQPEKYAKVLQEIAGKATSNAADRAIAKNIPQTRATAKEIVRIHPDGRKETVSTKLPKNYSGFFVSYDDRSTRVRDGKAKKKK